MIFNRELTFAEKKVNFKNLDKMGSGLSSILNKKLEPILKMIINKDPNQKIKDVLVNILTLIQKESFEVGKKNASKEMKIKTPKTNNKIILIFKSQNEKIVDKILKDLRDKLRSKGFSEEGLIKQVLSGFKSLFVYGSINMGREVIFEQNKDQVYAFQYSAILDGSTTDLCKSLDGLTISPLDPRRQKYNPPNHWNCRSIWVEILVDEEYKPELLIKEGNDSNGIMKQYKNVNSDLGIQETKDLVLKEERKKNIENLRNEYEISMKKAREKAALKNKKQDIIEEKIVKNKNNYGIYHKVTQEQKDLFKNNIDDLYKKSGYDDIINSLVKKGKGKIDIYEAFSLKNYTQKAYETNSLLRGINIVKDNEDMILGRSYYLTEALNKLPTYKGIVSRGIDLSNDFIKNIISNLKVGDIYIDNGFMSTTKGENVAKSFEGPVRFKIQSISGVDIQKFSAYGSKEKEVLFKTNTRFKVNNIQDIDGIKYIDMDEVDNQEFKEQNNIANQLGEIYDKQLQEIRKKYKKVESK